MLIWVHAFRAVAPPTTGLPRVILGVPALADQLGDETDTVFIPVATPGVSGNGHLCRTDGVVMLPLHRVIDSAAAWRGRGGRPADGCRSGRGNRMSRTLILSGGRVVDPTQAGSGEVRDVALRDGRIVDAAPPAGNEEVIDCSGCVVMAGGIDLHSHIGGGKVNLARMLLPELQRNGPNPLACTPGSDFDPCSLVTPGTLATGHRYAQMGYTAAFEPAMVPANARHAHMEMGDTPILDHGAYVMLGNDELFLRLMSEGAPFEQIRDYMGWTIRATKALGVKVVNPGGISAFKFNQRRLNVDEAHTHWQVTPRQIVHLLARSLQSLGVPHPLHIHGSNLGVAGNIQSTLDTIAALEGLPAHLTHIQFHAYGTEGPKKFSSAALQLADAVNAHPNISIDVGQIIFGQTVTASGDTMRQHANAGLASPRKWIGADIECDAGCGVVPFRYREQSYVNALQWAIGLEIFLLVNDPWRVVLTTDHPNGGHSPATRT